MSRGFLLDTNVPPELTKPMPNVRVRDWIDAQDDASLYLNGTLPPSLICRQNPPGYPKHKGPLGRPQW